MPGRSAKRLAGCGASGSTERDLARLQQADLQAPGPQLEAVLTITPWLEEETLFHKLLQASGEEAETAVLLLVDEEQFVFNASREVRQQFEFDISEALQGQAIAS